MDRITLAARSAMAIALVAAVASGCGAFGAPEATALTDGDVEPGRYFTEVDGNRYTFTVAEAGWSYAAEWGGLLNGDDDSTLAVMWAGGDMGSLYRRACESSGTDFDPGASVDELATALASLEDFDVAAPAAVSVSGFDGKRVAVAVPMDVDVRSSACDGSQYSLSPDRWFQASGQKDDMWILDLDGERQLLVASTTPGTPPAVTSQLEAIMDSIEIEPN